MLIYSDVWLTKLLTDMILAGKSIKDPKTGEGLNIKLPIHDEKD